LRLAVFLDGEVVLRQAMHGLAMRVGDDDIYQHAVDSGLERILRGGGRRVCLSRRSAGRLRHEKNAGAGNESQKQLYAQSRGNEFH
jgi:hypothetical protein